MEMVLATSEASNTARKLQLSANCWPAGRAGNRREGGREREWEILKQGRCIAKKFTTSVGQLIEPLFGRNSMISKYFIGCSE